MVQDPDYQNFLTAINALAISVACSFTGVRIILALRILARSYQ